LGAVPRSQPIVLTFDENERSPVVDRMRVMAETGTGWINLSPGLDVDEPPPPQSALGTLIGGRGPTVPLATWMPARGGDPATVGIEHGQGPRALDRLTDDGVPLPEGWHKLQDHPRRGLVVVPTAGTAAPQLDAVLHWLLRAAAALCPVRRTGEWRAYCYGM
jgi:hypothetical protein